jgi:hypothetical protein
VKSFGKRVANFSGIFGRGKISEEVCFPSRPYSSGPFAFPLVPHYSDKAARIVASFPVVTLILRCRCFTKISSSIIKRVSVYMVGVFPGYLSMHVNMGTVKAQGSSRVPIFYVPIPTGVPIPLVEPFKVRCINYGIFALCKGNQAVRFVKRLGNRMSFHAFLRHIAPPVRCATSRYSSMLAGWR